MAENRIREILKTSIIAILVNVALGIFKAFVGMISKSVAITMDAVNNFTDAAGSLITIVSAHFAGKTPDKKHPFGYGRTEYLGTLLIAGIILYAGITAFSESVKSIISPETPSYSGVSLFIIVVAVVAKLLLTLYMAKTGKRVKSDSLIASSKEALGDIAISVATLLAALLYIFTGFAIEAYLGVAISVVIIKSGVDTLREIIGKILGAGAEASLVVDVKKAIVAHENVEGAFDIVLHNYGPDSYMASVHVAVPDTLSASDFDVLSREIQDDIFEKFGIYITAVGVYSVNKTDNDVIEKREKVKAIVSALEYVNQMHGFYIDDEKKQMRFDLVISFGTENRQAVYDKALAEIKKEFPDYEIEAGLDSDFNEI